MVIPQTLLLFSRATSSNWTDIFPLESLNRTGVVQLTSYNMIGGSPEYHAFLNEHGITEKIRQQRIDEIMVLLHSQGYLREEFNAAGKMKALHVYLPYTLPVASRSWWERFNNWAERGSAKRILLSCNNPKGCTVSDQREMLEHVRSRVRDLYVDFRIYDMYTKHMNEKQPQKPRTTL